MNKKLLIAGFFATIMLLFPLSAVTGASVKGLNTTEEVIAESYPDIPDYLLEIIYERIDYLLVNYGHIQEIVDACNEILAVINSLDPDSPLCLGLYNVMEYIGDLWWEYYKLSEEYEETHPILSRIYGELSIVFFIIALDLYFLGIALDCWEPPPPPFDSETGLNLQTTLDAILTNGATTEVSICPCSQPDIYLNVPITFI